MLNLDSLYNIITEYNNIIIYRLYMTMCKKSLSGTLAHLQASSTYMVSTDSTHHSYPVHF